MRTFVLVVFASFFISKGYSQKVGFEIDFIGGIGYTSWTTTQYFNGIMVNGNTYYEDKEKGSGTNSCFRFSTVLKLDRFRVAPVFGVRNYSVGELKSDLGLEGNTRQEFNQIWQYGLSLGYDIVRTSKNISVSPYIELGSFTPNIKLARAEDYRNKYYGAVGLIASKIIDRWKINLIPNLHLASGAWIPTGFQKVFDQKVLSVNLDLGVTYKLK